MKVLSVITCNYSRGRNWIGDQLDFEPTTTYGCVYMLALACLRRQRIGNFKTEPPGLFRGRGDHPKQGRIKVLCLTYKQADTQCARVHVHVRLHHSNDNSSCIAKIILDTTAYAYTSPSVQLLCRTVNLLFLSVPLYRNVLKLKM